MSAHTDTNTENLLAQIAALKEQLAQSQAEKEHFKAQVVERSSSSTSVNNQLTFIRNDIIDFKNSVIPKLNSIQESQLLTAADISNLPELASISAKVDSLEQQADQNQLLDSARFLDWREAWII